jgi:hypothetical protein
MKYIYHHLGLGDHIICNGLVRTLLNLNVRDEYSLFVKKHNEVSVKFMYNDLTNLKTISVNSDNCVREFICKNKIADSDLLICGFNDPSEEVSWDELFYFQHNVDFKNRWDKFKVKRNFVSENSLYKQLNPNNEEYILIHSKGSDNIERINYDCISTPFKKIFVEKHTDNIFDYLTLIELANEIHCVTSSFHVLVDSLSLNNKLFLHTVLKSRGFSHKLKNIWQIV